MHAPRVGAGLSAGQCDGLVAPLHDPDACQGAAPHRGRVFGVWAQPSENGFSTHWVRGVTGHLLGNSRGEGLTFAA